MILTPGQPIPHGRPYHYHLNGSVHMMTTRKRVGPLPTHHLAERHSVDYSSSNHFASNDSLRDSSSETSSDSPSDDLSNSSSDHSLLEPSSGMRPSHHLCSLKLSIPHSSATISTRPSHDSSSASPSRKKISDVGDIVSTASIPVINASAATTNTATITTVGDFTLAQALEEIKSTKPKEKGIDIQVLGKSTPTKSSQQSQDKGKGIFIKPVIKPVKYMKRKDQIRFDEEAALKLQAAFDEEESLIREKFKKVEEANITLIET
nr:hypothetical protein [Tanacetum cinerariifolium]